MADMFLGSQTPLYQNVCITKRKKNGKVVEQRFAKNRITKLMLYGIGRFLLGHFNDSTPDKIYEVIPRYLALGTNIGDETQGITNVSSVNDTRLLNEIIYNNDEPINRLYIAERNISKLNTKFSDPYIKISIKTYINSSAYNGVPIGEAGLFSKGKDNNCLARVCFAPFIKSEDEVLDIQWDITLLSYGETKYPENISLENGNKLILPLHYTPHHYKSINTYLQLNTETKEIMIIPENIPIFKREEDASFTPLEALYDLQNHERFNSWRNKLKEQLNSLEIIEQLYIQISNGKIDDLDNPYYITLKNLNIPSMVHFNSLYGLNDNSDLYTLCVEYGIDCFVDNVEEKTKYKYIKTSDTTYEIKKGREKTQYTIIDNQFYEKLNDEMKPLNAYLYNGLVVNSNMESLGYSYHDDYFYILTRQETEISNNSYLNYNVTNIPDSLREHKLVRIYNINDKDYNVPDSQLSENVIDISDNYKILTINENTSTFTTYHLSEDKFWVYGDSMSLIAKLEPSSVTDKSINWYSQKPNTVTVNSSGIINAWNLGEARITATTTNDLSTYCDITVIKDSSIVLTDGLSINPETIIMYLDDNINKYYTITATVSPDYATFKQVKWKIDSSLKDAILTVNLGNNKLKVMLSGKNIVGSGYITAYTQDGKSAKCFVEIGYSRTNENDCPDPSHLIQQG